MSAGENKDLIRRYIAAIDNNHTSDWSILDEYIAENFVAHDPPIPGVSLDRDGMKQAAEIFRVATPGRHEITMQVAEGDLVVSRIRDGNIVDYWVAVGVARVLQYVSALPGPTASTTRAVRTTRSPNGATASATQQSFRRG